MPKYNSSSIIFLPYRNCVESSKAGIVSNHASEENEALVCKSLENMLDGCDSQVSKYYVLVNTL